MGSFDQFRDLPNVIRNARFHRMGSADAGMNAAEIVEREVQRDSGPMVLALARERIRPGFKVKKVGAD